MFATVALSLSHDTQGDRWRADAACIDWPLELFFPAPYVSHSDAKAVCASCPVRVACCADALDTHEHAGIRAGFNFGDQRNRRRASRWLADQLQIRQDSVDTRIAG